ncbi:MAG: hypothetical protein ACE5FI_15040, partial [Anaerolineales bacterium]
LIPNYLARAPQPRCFGPHRWFGNELDARSAFELQTCDRPGVTLLTVPQVTTEFIQRMDLDSNRWSTISFLDGVCSYLD